jgi:hypothetical protein
MSGCAWGGALLFLPPDAYVLSHSRSRLPIHDLSHPFTVGGTERGLPIFPDLLGILFASCRPARRGAWNVSRAETIAAMSSVGRQRI